MIFIQFLHLYYPNCFVVSRDIQCPNVREMLPGSSSNSAFNCIMDLEHCIFKAELLLEEEKEISVIIYY
jgi:hypothetical protein